MAMGISNVQGDLEERIAAYKGELEKAETETKRVEEDIEVLHFLGN